jgi:hypothetical protein
MLFNICFAPQVILTDRSGSQSLGYGGFLAAREATMVFAMLAVGFVRAGKFVMPPHMVAITSFGRQGKQCSSHERGNKHAKGQSLFH